MNSSQVKRLFGNVVLLLLVLLFVKSDFAQVGNDKTKKRTYYHDEDVETQYDKKEDRTKVEIRRMLVPVITFPGEPVLNLNVYYTYPNKLPKRPESIVLGFVSVSNERERKFQDNRELVATLDNQTVSLGTPELLEAKILPRSFREVLAMYLPFETFLRLINTRHERVEMRLGNVKFELKKEHLEALRDLASRVE